MASFTYCPAAMQIVLTVLADCGNPAVTLAQKETAADEVDRNFFTALRARVPNLPKQFTPTTRVRGGSVIDDIYTKIKDAGYAAPIDGVMDPNLKRDMFQAAGIVIGGGFIPRANRTVVMLMQDYVDDYAPIVSKFISLVPVITTA